MPTRSWLRLLLLAPLFTLSTAPHAEVYKSVDEHGKVQYGDRPSGTQSEQIQIKTSPAQPDPDAAEHREKSRKLLNEFSDEQAEKKQQAVKHQEEEAQRKANCELAQKHLDEYEHAARLYVTDKNGERRNLTGDEYSKALENSRAAVKQWCRP
jgi:hypothetical protein